MVQRMKLFSLIIVTLATISLAIAQGSASGYGQGGGQGGGGFGGGGFEGGFGGNSGAASSEYISDEDAAKGKVKSGTENLPGHQWDQKSAILTPGDKYELKIEGKKGEVVMAAVTSDAFDPALEMVDEKKVVLAKNDDREDGEQSPFLIVRFPADGTYKLNVMSYRSVSGGKFNLKMRRFIPSDAGFSKQDLSGVAFREGQYGRQEFGLRVQMKAGQIYDLTIPKISGDRYTAYSQWVSITGPTGVTANDYEQLEHGSGTVIAAKISGDYYLEFATQSALNVSTDFREVTIEKLGKSEEKTLAFKDMELKIVEFDVLPEQIVRTILNAPYMLSSKVVAPTGAVRRNNSGSGGYGDNDQFSWYLPNRDNELDAIRIFHGKGVCRFLLRSQLPTALKATISNSQSLPSWEIGKPQNGQLAIGEAKLFLLNPQKSELMRVLATAEHFQPKIEIFRMNGDLANTLMDRRNHRASDDLYFPDNTPFIVRLSCDGDGGSGNFALSRTPPSLITYKLGVKTQIDLRPDTFSMYSVELEAGKRYQMLYSNKSGFIRTDLLDETGEFLYSGTTIFDDIVVQYFTPKRTGKHRLWLRGNGKFEIILKPHKAPSLDDK